MTSPGVTSQGRFDPLHPVVLKGVTRVMGLQNGVSALLFGAILLAPASSFAVSKVYDPMIRSGITEPIWGAVYLTLGVVQIFAHMLPLTGLWRFVMMVAWLYLASMFLLGDYRSTGWPQYFWDAIFAGTLFALETASRLREKQRVH